MKTRLLKKVRKRFSIKKVTDIGTRPSSKYIYGKEQFGLPFYLIEDNSGYILSEWVCAGDKDSALNILQDMIVKVYHEKFRGREAKTEKIWRK